MLTSLFNIKQTSTYYITSHFDTYLKKQSYNKKLKDLARLVKKTHNLL